ncbi:DUF4262 domain-containing protein [Rhodococcus sp. NPDC003318]|uniref:DUF4262 domain-containing protein n=1 Tax=Rhodococcus sp. NPDC003318 TaxID=3364503 RepID=UPI0036CC1C61
MSPREIRREMRRTIAQHGWLLQYVASAIDEQGVHPAFCYSVGLTAIGRPELVVTGRCAEESAMLLNELGSWMRCGHDLEPGDRYSVAGLDVTLVAARDCESWLLRAVDLYGRHVRALQVVWADCRGLLPWEGSSDSTIVQPLLGLPPGAGA